MTIDDIKPGQRWRIINPANASVGMVLTVDYVDEYDIVRFTDAPFTGFGAGMVYFLKSYELVDQV